MYPLRFRQTQTESKLTWYQYDLFISFNRCRAIIERLHITSESLTFSAIYYYIYIHLV